VSEEGFGDWGGGTGDSPAGPTAIEQEAYLELIGTHLRASGVVDVGRFRRISDYVNLLLGFFALRDVVFLTRTGESTKDTVSELRVRLDDVAVVGQLVADPLPPPTEQNVVIPKQAHRLVVMTRAHLVDGFVYIHEHGSLMQFVDSSDPRWIPMTNVRVRWLDDRQVAATYPFALIQRTHMIGFATEGTGTPREAQAKRRAVVAEARSRPAPADAMDAESAAVAEAAASEPELDPAR
jgi:hypothetical protein